MHPLFRAAFVLCTTLLFAAQAAAAEVRTYAVTPFAVNGPSGFSYLEKAVPSMLNSRLYWEDHFEPASDEALAKAGRVTDQASAAKALAASGVSYVVWGDVAIVDQQASVSVRVLGKDGKSWSKTSDARIDGLVSVLQNLASSLNSEVFGRGGGPAPGAQGAPAGNAAFTTDDAVQRQVYLNPEFRYQGSDGVRLRSQTMPFPSVGMAVADVTGNGMNEVVLLGEKRLYVLTWKGGSLAPLGEYVFSPRLTPVLVRTIDLDRDGAEEIVLSTYDEESTTPYAFLLSFKDGKFVELVKRAPYYVNVVRLLPSFMNTLIGQRGDPGRIFSRSGVYELTRSGDSFVQTNKLALPSGVNALNFAYLPGKAGQETDKLVTLNDNEKLRVLAIGSGDQLYQSDEMYSGSSVGIAEQTHMPGMGKDTILLPSSYYIPMRMIPNDLERDGTWEILVNRPFSVTAQFLENYRLFPEGEIHDLYWDGVGMALRWKTRRIKGTVVDYDIADMNNDGTKDLVVCVNTHPGALGLQSRKTLVVAYPLDVSRVDPNTPAVLD